MTTENKPTYPESITPLFKQGFRQNSLIINDEIMEKLAGVELGGRLVVRFLKEESVKTSKSPTAYLEYLTPNQVADAKQKYEEYKAGKGAGDGGI